MSNVPELDATIDYMGAGLAAIRAADTRRTVELPAVVMPADPNVIAFTAPREWSLGEVFFTLRQKCGIAEPVRVVLTRTPDGWTARAELPR